MTETTVEFAATRDAFAQAVACQKRGGASFSATVDGAEVLTLVAGEAHPGSPWQEDTGTCVMSVTKGIAGLVVAMLTDRGLLDPEERVATYWPEFGVNGKQDMLVRDVLLHTCGVLGSPEFAQRLSWDGSGWDDLDAIADVLAEVTPSWAPGTRAGYHAMTFGWLVGELVRRTDGRTLGQFFREELAVPLGLQTAIGLPVDQQQMAYVWAEGMDDVGRLMAPLHRRARARMRNPAELLGLAMLGDGSRSALDVIETMANSPAWIAAEVPSSNGISSARDLARLFAAVACGGELDGVRLLSRETLNVFCEGRGARLDCVMASSTGGLLGRALRNRYLVERTDAFMANKVVDGWGRYGPSPRAVGCEGYGGQVVFADPDRQVSVAFVRNDLRSSQAEINHLVRVFYDELDDGGTP